MSFAQAGGLTAKLKKSDIADTYPNVNPKNKMGEGNYPTPKQP